MLLTVPDLQLIEQRNALGLSLRKSQFGILAVDPRFYGIELLDAPQSLFGDR
jgi:hypothetical protein